MPPSAFFEVAAGLVAFADVLAQVLAVVAALLIVGGYVNYFRDIRRETVQPNRWSWLIWSVAASVEAATYQALNAELLESIPFFLSGASCMVLAALIWKRSRWKKPKWPELATTAASITALVLWLMFQKTFWAQIIATIAVPIAFFPTWDGVRNGNENSRSWGIWSLGYLATLAVILLRLKTAEQLPYAVVELVCHAAVWRIAARQRRSHKEGSGQVLSHS